MLDSQFFLQCFDCWKGIWPIKTGAAYLQRFFREPRENRLTQVHLENGRENGGCGSESQHKGCIVLSLGQE